MNETITGESDEGCKRRAYYALFYSFQVDLYKSSTCIIYKSCDSNDRMLPDKFTITYQSPKRFSDPKVWHRFSETKMTCDENDGNKIVSMEGLTLEQCKEKALKSKDVTSIWYAEEFRNYDKSICTFYKSCDLKKGRMPKRPGITYQKKETYYQWNI